MLRNLILEGTATSFPYERPNVRDGGGKRPQRERAAHARKLSRELSDAYAEAGTAYPDEGRAGTYLQFNSSAGYGLTVDSLENGTRKIRVLNYRFDSETGRTSSTVFVPSGKEDFFSQRISEYETKDVGAEDKRKPSHQKLIDSIDDIDAATPHSLWVGPDELYPSGTVVWCELWLDVPSKADAVIAYGELTAVCKLHGIQLSEDYISFPENLVALVKVSADDIDSLFSSLGHISGIKRSPEPNSDIVSFDSRFQREMAADLASRIDCTDDRFSVCVLDRGMNESHPVLNACIDSDSVLAARDGWGASDDNGHGTSMAGIALLDDVKAALLSRDRVPVGHRIESVKIVSPGNDTDATQYGTVTEDAVSSIELNHPTRSRIFCMAVTEKDTTVDEGHPSDGKPTSWSAKLDDISAASTEDMEDKRLIIVSAGNANQNDLRDVGYPATNINTSVESPAQAWNVLTVGAYSSNVIIGQKGLSGYQALAAERQLGPFSTTSITWGDAWPIKPEICCDGGNIATDGNNLLVVPDLERLSFSSDLPRQYFSTIGATSAATAQASWMAARIAEHYPEIWPETIRALMVHSARWTDEMVEQFCSDEGKRSGKRALLRCCGWGVPNLERAIECLDNRVNLVIQGELQPYTATGTANEMHLHEIPWPTEILRQLGEKTAEIRITLSYFVEPNPSGRGWKGKFSYQSHGLKFQLINKDQTRDDFLKSISAKMRGEDKKDSGGGTTGTEEWYLGPNNRDVGSIHSDFKRVPAAYLCDARYVAVYPVTGWWAKRTSHKRMEHKTRYALIVSIETPGVDSDIYNAIVTEIENQTRVTIPTPVER